MAVNLQKGSRVSLKKDNGADLTNICVGVNWGAIEKKGLFGSKKIAVDLDASVGLFNEEGALVDTIYFGQLNSKCGSIKHSGDDRTGDVDGDDGLDNEVIQVNLARVPANVHHIAFILNSYRGQDFKDIPFASIRIYEGKPERVDEVFATLNVSQDPTFSGSIGMIMGRMYRHNNEWKFAATADATGKEQLQQTLTTFSRKYLGK